MFLNKRLDGMWESDTMDGQKKALDGNRYSQVFYNFTFFADKYPMDT